MTVTIIEPMKWSLRDAAAFINVASRLERLSAEMDTERHHLEVEAKGLAEDRVREAARQAIEEAIRVYGADREEAARLASKHYGIPETELLALPFHAELPASSNGDGGE